MQALTSHNPMPDRIFWVGQRNTRKRAIANDRPEAFINQWDTLWIGFVYWSLLIAIQNIYSEIWFALDRVERKKLH